MHPGLHHAEQRKKEGKADMFDRVMIVVGLVGPLSLLPQVIQVWTQRDIAGISLLSWTLLAIVSFMWVLYGISRHSKALVISNLLLMIFNLAVVVGVLMFR